MPGAERHIKVLTNVWAHQVFKCLAYVDTMRWAHQVFKCLAYVDTMRVMNTKMLADTQRKLLDIKLFTNGHLF